MEEKHKNRELEQIQSEKTRDPQSEFESCVEKGFYKTLAKNEFFQNLEPEEQYDAMHMTLQNCLDNREKRFYRLVVTRPELSARYRDQEIKPLRTAINALDEIASVNGKEFAMQEDIGLLQEDIDKAA